jgi:hypothetical protein
LHTSSQSRDAFRAGSGVETLIRWIKSQHDELLINSLGMVYSVCQDPVALLDLYNRDLMTTVWSVLTSKTRTDPAVQANAAGALAYFFGIPDARKAVATHYMNALPMLLTHLRSNSVAVLSNVCAAVGNLSKNREILSVLSEQRLLRLLASGPLLEHDDEPILQKQLAYAVSEAVCYKTNRTEYGHIAGLAQLVGFLKSDDVEVLRSTCVALTRLTQCQANATTLKTMMSDTVLLHRIIVLMGNKDEVLALSAAAMLGNTRQNCLDLRRLQTASQLPNLAFIDTRSNTPLLLLPSIGSTPPYGGSLYGGDSYSSPAETTMYRDSLTPRRPGAPPMSSRASMGTRGGSGASTARDSRYSNTPARSHRVKPMEMTATGLIEMR